MSTKFGVLWEAARKYIPVTEKFEWIMRYIELYRIYVSLFALYWITLYTVYFVSVCTVAMVLYSRIVLIGLYCRFYQRPLCGSLILRILLPTALSNRAKNDNSPVENWVRDDSDGVVRVLSCYHIVFQDPEKWGGNYLKRFKIANLVYNSNAVECVGGLRILHLTVLLKVPK